MKLRQAYQSMQKSYMQHGHADSDMNGSLNIQVSPKTRANRESPAKSAIIATESFRMRLLQTLRANAFGGVGCASHEAKAGLQKHAKVRHAAPGEPAAAVLQRALASAS